MNKTAYRPHRLAIDIAKPGMPALISLNIQKVELSDADEIEAITGYQHEIYITAQNVISDHVSFTDPVTGLDGNISVAGLDSVLKAFANRWTANSLECEIDSSTGWPINCKREG